MARWLMLAALSTALPLFGCGGAVRPGLANAPRLGGTSTADNRITDVVSNGDDGCGLYAEHSVLRNRIPPCGTWSAGRSAGVPAFSELPPPSTPPESGGLVQPWLDHFYVGWPCPTAVSLRQARSWSAPNSARPFDVVGLELEPIDAVATCSVR